MHKRTLPVGLKPALMLAQVLLRMASLLKSLQPMPHLLMVLQLKAKQLLPMKTRRQKSKRNELSRDEATSSERLLSVSPRLNLFLVKHESYKLMLYVSNTLTFDINTNRLLMCSIT